MKVYVAGSSGEIERAEKWMAALRAAGFEVTSTWPETIRKVGSANPMTATREQRAMWSAQDLSEVSDAEVFWLLLPEGKPSEGACVEFGYAVMLGATAKEARALGILDAPNFWMIASGVERSIFTALAEHFETDEKAFEVLKTRRTLLAMAAETKAAAPPFITGG